ncbi:microtubule-actin cross-linking factor 1, isoforms 6/7-like [Larus michahellis]|uniref:microtubule-actin cross-linking factor 1, isoforms 6/7-like n=1 Tax=Larus michahellis TaxID=119627 RepID=UPI003D9B13BC
MVYFHDKTDPTLESLKGIVERLRQPPSISAEVEKIKEQISENKNVSVDLEKLQLVYETLKQRGKEMIARSEGVDKDISAKAVQDKLDQMVLIWEDIWSLTEEREAKLLDVMKLAAKLWCSHVALAATIKDTQELIGELEGPGVDPSVVTQEQEDAEAAKEETDGLQEELATVLSLGSELRAACGEPDKPVVNKSIDELNSAWDALSKTRKERADKLVEALQAAVQYQDGLQLHFCNYRLYLNAHADHNIPRLLDFQVKFKVACTSVAPKTNVTQSVFPIGSYGLSPIKSVETELILKKMAHGIISNEKEIKIECKAFFSRFMSQINTALSITPPLKYPQFYSDNAAGMGLVVINTIGNRLVLNGRLFEPKLARNVPKCPAKRCHGALPAFYVLHNILKNLVLGGGSFCIWLIFLELSRAGPGRSGS